MNSSLPMSTEAGQALSDAYLHLLHHVHCLEDAADLLAGTPNGATLRQMLPDAYANARAFLVMAVAFDHVAATGHAMPEQDLLDRVRRVVES